MSNSHHEIHSLRLEHRLFMKQVQKQLRRHQRQIDQLIQTVDQLYTVISRNQDVLNVVFMALAKQIHQVH
jgi:hypothetical protein